jgi:hypothetical protein
MKKILFYICLPAILLSACKKDDNARPESRFSPWAFANCESRIQISEGENKVAELSIFLNEVLTYRDSSFWVTDTTDWTVFVSDIDTAGSLIITYYDSIPNTTTYQETVQIPEYQYNLSLDGWCSLEGYRFELIQPSSGDRATFIGPFDVSGLQWPYEDTKVNITTPDGKMQEYPLTKNDIHDACTDHQH